MTQSRSPLVSRFVCLILALVTLLAYLPVCHHSFVLFDDSDYVTDNRMVQAGLTWAGIKWAFTTGHASNWHPLTWLSHMLDVQLFGTGPTAPHVVNVLFHVANTVLLFIVLRRLTGALWQSTWVAALFALHPLHVESVAWVAERKDVLSAFFFLLTLWAYGKYVESSRVRNSRSGAWYGCALLLFALGLMSKPIVVTLPFVLLLLDYWPLRRLAIGDWQLVTRHLVREKVPFFLLSALSCVVTFVAQHKGGTVRSLASFSVGERFGNGLVSYGQYLGRTFWPVELAVFYPHPGQWPAGQVMLAGVLVAGLCLGAAWLGRRFPFAVVGWYWFVGMMIPVIGLVQVSNQSMADRYTYLPLIGVFMIVAWGAGEVVARWELPKVVVGIAAGGVAVACAAGTEAQLGYWRDSESLFRHALAVTKDNFVAYNSLGNALLEKGQVDEAIAHFQKTLEIQPDYADVHNNLGNALLQKGRVDEAIAHFQRALKILPNHELAHYNLGNALLQKGRVDEAINQFQKALEIRPDYADAHNNLGNVLLQKGRVDEAITQFQKALATQSDFADAHNNLGAALLEKGRVDEAITQFQKALGIQLNHSNAHYNLGNALLRKGQTDEAITHYQKALEIKPSDADTHNNLGTALVLKDRLDEAMTHFQRVLEIQPGFAQAHDNLAFILLRKGQVREAAAHYQTALKLEPDNARALSNFAWVLATWPEPSVRDGARAIELAQRANRLADGQDPVILCALAAGYAEGGRFAEAVTAAQRALQLAAARSDAALADALRSQIKLYQAGFPFRDTGQTDGVAKRGQP